MKEICGCLHYHFKEVTPFEIDLIYKYLKLTDYKESNHNLLNMFEWSDLYPLYYHKGDNYLVLIGLYNDEYFMYMPLCKKEYFLDALKYAKDLFDACNIPFLMACFTEEYKDLAMSIYPKLKVKTIDNAYDYIYEVAKLRTFSGKKLQKKRNHINNFYKLYKDRYTYEDLSYSNIDEVKAFVLNLKAESETLVVERRGILFILDLFDKLEYKGGIIKIDGKIEALIIVSVLNDDMLQENIEKANREIVGLYQVLIKEFLEHNYLDYTYINREDDMGIEELRKSKMSYYPCCFIEKFYLEEK